VRAIRDCAGRCVHHSWLLPGPGTGRRRPVPGQDGPQLPRGGRRVEAQLL